MMIHGKQIQDFSIRLGKINPSSNQLLTLVGTSKIQQNAAPILGIDLTNKIYVDTITDALDTRVTDLESVVFYQNELISGGASFLSGLTFAVTDLVYIINGHLYNSLATNVTISAGDATYDRIDIIAVNTAGVVSVIPGIPAMNPIKPDIDESTQVEVTFITVPAGAVTLPIPITVVYNENLGPASEWTTATNFPSNINVNSTTGTPYMGSKSIELTNVPTAKTIVFTAPANFDTTTQNTLQFAIKNKIAWTTSRRLRITLQSLSGVQLGSIVDVYQGLYGFSSANTTAWQVITIPISKFLAPSAFIGKIVITTYSTSGTLNLYLDYFRLIVGAPVPTTQNAFLNIKDNAGNITTATTSTDILSILGGTNITSVVGAKTLTLNLNPNISVTNATITSATANRLAYFDGTKTLAPITLGTGLTLTGNILSAAANTTASNGLTKTGNDIKLGGLLTGATFIDGTQQFQIGANTPLTYFGVYTADVSYTSAIQTGYGNVDLYSADTVTNNQTSISVTPVAISISSYDQVNNLYGNITLYNEAQTITNNGSDNYFIIEDKFSFKGFVYIDDYSANFTLESLITRRFVETAINSITPSGTQNFISKFTTASTLGDSNIFDNGSKIGFFTTNFGGGDQIVMKSASNSDYADNLSLYSNNETQKLSLSWGGISATYYLKLQSGVGQAIILNQGGGNVGINTPYSPNYKLEVIGSNNSIITSIGDLSTTIATAIFSSRALYGTTSAHDLGLITTGSERVTITSGGNVGIGNTNPLFRFDVTHSPTNFFRIGGSNIYLQQSASAFIALGYNVPNDLYLWSPEITIHNHTSSKELVNTSTGNIGVRYSYNAPGFAFISYNVAGINYFEVNHVGHPENRFGVNVTPTATIHAKGLDATSSNYALKIDNSNDIPLLHVRNDKVVNISDALIKNKSINLLGVESFYPGEIYALSVFADTFVGKELRFWNSSFSKIYEGSTTYSIAITTGGGQFLEINTGLVKIFNIPTSYTGATGLLGIDSTGKLFDTGISVTSVGSFSTAGNKTMVAYVSTVTGEQLADPIISLPFNDSYVQVFINGIKCNIGDGVDTSEVYFADPSDLSTPKLIQDIAIGDVLVRGDLLGFDTDNTDTVDYDYLIS